MGRRLGVQACCDHNDIANGIGGALPVESTSQAVRTNGHGIKTGVQYSTVQYSTVQYSTAAESGRKERSLRVSTRFAPETEDGRGDAGWDG